MYVLCGKDKSYMTKIYIARHGQTDSNMRNACIGHTDVPLNAVGEEQARMLAEKLSEINFETVYTSPLLRAVNTAEPILQMTRHAKLIMNYGLVERDFGLWDNMTFDEIQEKYPVEYERWRKDWVSYRPPDGESIIDIYNRAKETSDRILTAHKDENILIVTHLGISRTILAYLLGLTAKQSQCFWLENTGIAVVEYVNGKGILKGLNI